jgi:VWFA-related protein
MHKKVIILILSLFFYIFTFGMNTNPNQESKLKVQLQYEVTVTLKLIQVYVTDKNGNPVTNLTKDDFILYDNGRLQPITDFEKHLLFLPEKKVEEKITETELPQSKDVSSMLNRKFFLFLDIDRNDAAGISKSKKAALHFINTRLQPTDEVGVLSYSWIVGLVIHQYLTSDFDKAGAAIKRIKEVPGVRPTSEMETLSAPRGGVTLEGESGGAEAETEIEQESSNASFLLSPTGQGGGALTAQTKSFIDVLKELAKALSHIEGYKNIILFSRGVPSSLLFSRDQLLKENYEDMGKELATSNSPVHTVNTLPLGVPISERKPPLDMLSELSGGKYFDNVDDYEEVSEQIQNVTSNYYVLGYYIDDKWDGRYHEVEVKVKRAGCVVHAQAGYFNPKPFSKLSDFEKQLHLIDIALGKGQYYKTPYSFPLEALPCPIEDKPGLILISEIHMDEIEEAIGKETEIVTLILDKENNIVDSTRGEVDLTTVPQKLLHHYAISSLAPGDYECRVVLRNLKTGRSALGSSSAAVPEVQQSGIFVYSPLILIPNTPCFYLRASKTEKEKESSKTVSLNDIYPFLANNHSPLVNEIDGDVHKLFTVLKFSAKDIPDSKLNIVVDLVHQPTEEWIPLKFQILNSQKVGTESAFLLELYLPELKPGQYTIEFYIAQNESEIVASAERAFRVGKISDK